MDDLDQQDEHLAYGGGSRPFQTTAIHEFGHAAGLGHENAEYNIMGEDWTHISCNGSTYRSYVGEDANDGLVGEQTESNNAAIHVFQVLCDSIASTNFYNQPPNPPSLTASPFELGEPFWLQSDVSMSGHLSGVVFAFDTTANVPLAGGQRLLCIDGGSGELLGYSAQPGPTVFYSGTVPAAGGLCGFFFSAQALHFGGTVPFALSNARDIYVGSN